MAKFATASDGATASAALKRAQCPDALHDRIMALPGINLALIQQLIALAIKYGPDVAVAWQFVQDILVIVAPVAVVAA